MASSNTTPIPRIPWWSTSLKGPALAAAVWGRVSTLRAQRRWQCGADLVYEAIFRGRRVGAPGFASPTSEATVAPAQIPIAKAKVNAILSRMSKHRPFPVISCEDADWTEKGFATRVSNVLRSKLGATDVERTKLLLIRDALIRGSGVAKVVRTEDGDVAVERTPRSELMVGARDARYGEPRSIFQLKSYAPEVLAARFDDASKEALRAIQQQASAATTSSDGYLIWGDEWADDSLQVEVAEAWHLPSSCDADDGRHVIAIKGHVLLDEPWTRPRAPFAILHWDPPVTGQTIFGSGLIESLMGIQNKITDTNRDIQEGLYWGAALKVFIQKNNVRKSHLRARHPAVVEYEGAKPIYEAPSPVSPQLFSYLDWLINIADDISGLSRDFQSGKTQLGAGASGKAMDTLDDIQSDRFAFFQLMHSLFMVDLGALVLDEARAISAGQADPDEDGEREEIAPWIKAHKWEEIDIDRGSYKLKLEPINFLPGTRSGKLEAIDSAAQAGIIRDPDDVLDLFDEPDLQRVNRKLLGPRRAIARLLRDLVDTSVNLFELQPDPWFPLESAMATVQAELNDAWADDAPEEVLQRFRDWLTLAEAEQKRRAPPPPTDPTMAGPPPADGAGLGGAPPPAPPPAGPIPPAAPVPG